MGSAHARPKASSPPRRTHYSIVCRLQPKVNTENSMSHRHHRTWAGILHFSLKFTKIHVKALVTLSTCDFCTVTTWIKLHQASKYEKELWALTKPFPNPHTNFCERYAQVRVSSGVIIIGAVSMMDGAGMTRRGGAEPPLPRPWIPFVHSTPLPRQQQHGRNC